MSELMDALASLPSAEPDAVRTELVRTRCRAALARTAARRSATPARASRRKAPQVWPAAIAALGVAYLAVVIGEALAIYRP